MESGKSLGEIVKEKRKNRNQEIAEMVKSGEYIPPAQNMHESWFPKRPILKKNQKDIDRLYRTKT